MVATNARLCSLIILHPGSQVRAGMQGGF